MDRQSLHEYTLAKCSDGSPAAYYIDEVRIYNSIIITQYLSNNKYVYLTIFDPVQNMTTNTDRNNFEESD